MSRSGGKSGRPRKRSGGKGSPKSRKKGGRGSGGAPGPTSEVRVPDIRRLSRDRKDDEGRAVSCERLFRNARTPAYAYEGKEDDVVEIARALARHPRVGDNYRRWVARWLWREKGEHARPPGSPHPSEDTVRKTKDVEAGLDAVLLLLEHKIADRRERHRGENVAAVPWQAMRGTFGETYEAWTDALLGAGVLRVAREARPEIREDEDGECRLYALDRGAASDHSRARENPFAERQRRNLARGAAREAPLGLVVRCCERPAGVAEFPPPEAEDEYGGDEGQREILRWLNEDPGEALAPFRDVYKQRHHNAFTRLRKEHRYRTTFSGHLPISIDLKSAFPRALASEEMRRWISERVGRDFEPDERLRRECISEARGEDVDGFRKGDPYAPLIREGRSRATVKRLFSEALHAREGEDARALGVVGEAYEETAKAIRAVKKGPGHHRFIKKLQRIEQRWLRVMLGACDKEGVPALPVYDEILIPEWAVPEIVPYARVKELAVEFEGVTPGASEGGRYNPMWFPEEERFVPKQEEDGGKDDP